MSRDRELRYSESVVLDRPTGAIVDLDDSLLVTRDVHGEVMQLILCDMGVPAEVAEEIWTCVVTQRLRGQFWMGGELWDRIYATLLPGVLSIAQHLGQLQSLTPDEFGLEYRKRLMVLEADTSALHSRPELVPGADRLLRLLLETKGRHLAIFTGAPTALGRMSLELAGLGEFARFVASAEELLLPGRRKTNPDGWIAIVRERFGPQVDPHEILALTDIYREVQGAMLAGMPVVVRPRDQSSRDEDCQLFSIRQVAEWIYDAPCSPSERLRVELGSGQGLWVVRDWSALSFRD